MPSQTLHSLDVKHSLDHVDDLRWRCMRLDEIVVNVEQLQFFGRYFAADIGHDDDFHVLCPVRSSLQYVQNIFTANRGDLYVQ